MRRVMRGLPARVMRVAEDESGPDAATAAAKAAPKALDKR